MGAVTVKKIYTIHGENWARLSNGLAFIDAPLDYGPRIMGYGFCDGYNVLAENISIEEPNGWKMRGGHRLWHSPEQYPGTYVLDNNPVVFEVSSLGFKLIQEIEEQTHLEKSIEVQMDTLTSRVKLTHTLTNIGQSDIVFSVWPITVMPPGGLQIVPLNSNDTGYLPQQSVILWPGTHLDDSRLKWLKKFLLIKHDGADKIIKLGFNNKNAFAAYSLENILFIKKYFHEDSSVYPDTGASYETYLCKEMLEMESLSPLRRIEPGRFIKHQEEWNLLRIGINEEITESALETIFRENGYLGVRDVG